MTIAPITPDIFDVPARILSIVGKMQGERGTSEVTEHEAEFLFRVLNHFHAGEFHFSDSPAEPLLGGHGEQLIRRQREGSEATVAALRAAFGQRQHEDVSKEKIRRCLAFAVYGKKTDKLRSQEAAKVVKFFEVWYEELTKLPVST